MQHNQKGGVIMSRGNLALQGVTRSQAGNYSCVASNVEGDGDSNGVELKIMWAPTTGVVFRALHSGVASHVLVARVSPNVQFRMHSPPPISAKGDRQCQPTYDLCTWLPPPTIPTGCARSTTSPCHEPHPNLVLRNFTIYHCQRFYTLMKEIFSDKPVCRTEQKRIYGVARHENAKILCEVESYPPPDSFKWSFNNSAENVDVPQMRYHSGLHHFTSTLTYTPMNELDYGTVMCWANNLAGRQLEPCIFHVIAAGKPDPPFNCTIMNQTSESLDVECAEGFDGGQPQFFLLEVYDQQTDTLQANVSAKFPLFTVSGLDPGKILKMVVYAANSKGRSETVLLEGLMLKVAEKQTVLSLGTRDQLEITPILGILVGIVTALFLVTVVILGALKVRAAHREGSRALRPGFLPVKEKVTLPLRSESEDLFEKDDKNPDVIPANKDSDYQLGSAAQTPGLNNSVTATTEYETSSPQQNLTPLAEAYMARDRAYASQHGISRVMMSPTELKMQPTIHMNMDGDNIQVGNEVTYAELSLARPNSLETMKNGGSQYGTLRNREDSTIYAQIDHSRRMPPPVPGKTSVASPMVSPASSMFPAAKPGLYHRDAVTVRTPLMGCQQESCV
ncbi:hypothetical protein GEV33_011062 [Tenebrio molitor]|uniref:Ig-like domain-containing protein n=1 Tax=Tenebrio molitor TaxID=7067 RepID=A0A8J6L8G5_TENMO|nr:hypothetical protein GEV33_011062 [Tenebrio molitor]